MDILGPMRTFVRVVEAGSFTAVAIEQNTTQPTISRQIAALEDHLGARLFTRSTRSLALTDDGRAFYEQALRALEAISEAENAVGRRRAKPTGTLRLATSVVFGRLHIVPRLARFLERYPDLAVDLVLNDGTTDLVEEGIDLAIRVGANNDPSLIARRIGLSRRVAVASPAYLKARGTPKTLEDLHDHECIIYTRLASGNAWTFRVDGKTVSVSISGRYRVNSTEGVRAGVFAGLGIGMIPTFHFSDEIAKGRIRVLLKAHQPEPFPIHAVYPSRRFVPLKVRAMIDYLAAEFQLDPRLSDHPV
ncbi:MAG: LysR family transcriptional regulator [Hyphomicrobiaceae bacterium]